MDDMHSSSKTSLWRFLICFRILWCLIIFTISSISESDEPDSDELVSDEELDSDELPDDELDSNELISDDKLDSDEFDSDKLVSDEVELGGILVKAVKCFRSLSILIIYKLNLISLIENM